MVKVLIDTDPGTDDAIALMMAFSSRRLRVQGITTVGGNATLAHTTRNALRLMEYLDISGVHVSPGAARPLRGRFRYGYYYHGAAGLGVRLPSPRTRPNPVRAPELIAHLASAFPGQLVIVALGPLTNIARAMAIEPRLADGVREIVVMGGAVEAPGNVTPQAEFNIYNDPMAADLVLSSGAPIRMIGLDVCAGTYLTREELPWAPGPSRTAKLANEILERWFRGHPERERYELCDPLAMAAVIQPELLAYRRAGVAVETAAGTSLGKTTARYGDGPVQVAAAVDVKRAKALIVELLRLGAMR